MTAAELHNTLTALSITLHVEGNRLTLRGKTMHLTPELKEEITRQKPALCRLLQANGQAAEKDTIDSLCIRCRRVPRITTPRSFHCAHCRTEGIERLDAWRRARGMETYEQT